MQLHSKTNVHHASGCFGTRKVAVRRVLSSSRQPTTTSSLLQLHTASCNSPSRRAAQKALGQKHRLRITTASAAEANVSLQQDLLGEKHLLMQSGDICRLCHLATSLLGVHSTSHCNSKPHGVYLLQAYILLHFNGSRCPGYAHSSAAIVQASMSMCAALPGHSSSPHSNAPMHQLHISTAQIIGRFLF